MRRAPRLAALSVLTAGALTLSGGAAYAADTGVDEPATFTSMFTVMATPDAVVGMQDQPAPGQPGASGTFNYRINSDEEIICYDLTLRGVTGEYRSPARTATHIHEARSGTSGPPRLAFPDPEGDGETRTSSGCLQGPFTTGVTANGQDTGAGFSLREIEQDPAAFFGDTHTAEYTAGAVRGQLTPVPMGGVETGAGATADDRVEAGPAVALGAGALAALGAGVAVLRRRGARS
ncbi:CHRD domain-containing protein [Actinomycetospora cinnamomea]|uniref:CHRD domain-containing protein n=1 Tax=Actinomycetospora cinnamomea TaxID=663609 RepID=A0A2U1FRQ6_9PSEU|nr:CHRD domain-containing protein [Actinomycetospora cinnamomea]PVZ14846.1 CHRD domain-containing protein [Actinomycetospora cinnamomea]